MLYANVVVAQSPQTAMKYPVFSTNPFVLLIVQFVSYNSAKSDRASADYGTFELLEKGSAMHNHLLAVKFPYALSIRAFNAERDS